MEKLRRYALPFATIGLALAISLGGRLGGSSSAIAAVPLTGPAIPTAVAAALLSTGLVFVPVTPCRIVDTRNTGGPIGGGGSRSFTITGGTCGVPSTAVAGSLNVTILDMGTNGDFRVFPTGSAVPLVSTQNWTPSTAAIANAAVVPLGTGGAVTIQIDGTGSANVVLDVNGFFRLPNDATVTVVASGSVTAGSFDVQIADCPGGFHATGGGVDPENVLTMVVTSSNPRIGGTRTFLTANGQQGPATGWQATVRNNDTVTKTWKLAVICAPDAL